MAKGKMIKLGEHVKVELVMDGKAFLGLGGVWVDGVALRSRERPIAVRLDTPDGILYTRLEVTGLKALRHGGVAIAMRALGCSWGRGEYRDEYNQAMVRLGLPPAGVADRVVLRLQPVTQSLAGREWRGFSYDVAFESRTRAIHRILTFATWEIGGAVAGNTVLHQGQLNPPVWRGSKRGLFTTTCLKTLDQYGDPQGVSYQLGPRGGTLQTFDLQYAKAGALLCYWPEFDSISSLIESPRGVGLLHVVDEYRFAAAKKAKSLPKRILFSAGRLAEHEARDIWWDAYEAINGGIRAAFGVQETVVHASGGGGCAVKEYVKDRRHRVKMLGEEVDPAEALYVYADRVIPVLAKVGARGAGLFVTDNDVTAFGLDCKLDGGIHGELHVASICATHRFFPSDYWGGIKAWKYMADRAHARGMAVGHWFAPHFSPKAPIFKDHPEWLMTGVETHCDGGGYGHGRRAAIVTADWNTGVYDWALEYLTRWKQEGGLDSLFTDSWPNMALLPVNYAAGMRTNFRALGRLYHDLQKIGLMRHSFEGISPFGISHFGAQDLRGDLMEEKQGIAGQNDFGWWVGHEDMVFNVDFILEPRKRAEEEMRGILFRCMANRAGMSYSPTEPAPDLGEGVVRVKEWRQALNRIYEQALPHMKVRRLLPGSLGVRWIDGDTQVLWSYAPCRGSVSPRCRVDRLDGGEPVAVHHTGQVDFAGGCVYRIRGGGEMDVRPAG